MSMRGSRPRAWSAPPSRSRRPGVMMPPRYSPSRGHRVVGDRRAEVDDDDRAADLLVGRDRVDEAVGADLARVVVADRHAGPDPGPDDEHLVAEVARAPSPPTRARAAARSRRRSTRRGRRASRRAARAGCAARRRARRRSTRARSRSASARRARRRARSRSASGCCRRRRPGAWRGSLCSARGDRPLRRPRLAPVRRRRARARAEGARVPARRAAAAAARAGPAGAASAPAPCRRSRLDGRREGLGLARDPARASTSSRPSRRCGPPTREARALVERAEEWGDEVCQPIARRLLWGALRRRPAALASYARGSRLPLPGAGAPRHRAVDHRARDRGSTARPTAPSAPTCARCPATSTASTAGSPTACSAAPTPNAARPPDRVDARGCCSRSATSRRSSPAARPRRTRARSSPPQAGLDRRAACSPPPGSPGSPPAGQR